MRHFLFFLVFLFFLGEAGQSQSRSLDSLLTILVKTPKDTNRVDLLDQISHQQMNETNYLRAKMLALQALNLSESLSYNKGKAITYKMLGNIFFNQSNYLMALEFYFSNLKIKEEERDSVGIANIATNIGNTYYNEFDYDKALEYYTKAIRTYERLNMQRTRQYVNALLGEGAVYKDIQEFDKSLAFFLKAKETAERIRYEDGLGDALNNIGGLYKEKDRQYEKALEHYFSSLKIRQRLGYSYGIATTLNNIGSVYHMQNRNNEALIYAARSLALAKEIEAPDLAKDADDLLFSIYEAMGNSAKALAYFKEFVKVKDSLFSAANIRALASQEFQHEGEKKEMQFNKERLEKKIELQHQRVMRYAFTAGFALVLALVAFVFRNLQNSRKKSRIIQAQKEDVEDKKRGIEFKQKEILDSIYYAQRIQKCLLTNEKFIGKTLSRMMGN